MGGEVVFLQGQAARRPGAGKPRDKLGFVWTSRDLDRGGSDYLLGFVWTSWDRDRGGSDYLGNS